LEVLRVVLMWRLSVTEKCAADAVAERKSQTKAVRVERMMFFMVLLFCDFDVGAVRSEVDAIWSSDGWNMDSVMVVGWLRFF